MKNYQSFIVIALFALIFNDSCQPADRNNVTAKVDTVFMQQMQFQPAELTVNKGDTIVWVNNGIVVHNVTAYPDSAWTSDSMMVGDSWKKSVTDSFTYYCTIHPTMEGKIKIRDAE